MQQTRWACCEVIRAEKASGTRRDGRTELQVLLDFLRPGDALVVTRVDRLARSMKDRQDIVHELKAKGVALRATEQPIDTGTAAGKAFLDMLGVFAEFETNLRRERQIEGIVAAKARGVALPHLKCSHVPECCLIRIAPLRCSRCCIGGSGYGAHEHGDTG